MALAWIDFEGLLQSAFEQIRLYSKSDIAVSLRMLRALNDVAWTSSEPEYRHALYLEGKRIVDGCAERFA